jgi:hypothetical protein
MQDSNPDITSRGMMQSFAKYYAPLVGWSVRIVLNNTQFLLLLFLSRMADYESSSHEQARGEPRSRVEVSFGFRVTEPIAMPAGNAELATQ